ncbi:hypothetical protein F5144DRAFT_358659 [Chaetomium tenue]|uniref:Uncharacterized protein n=1 Tax=Chaetomium tenue TaxID=1854479 RepID=A0ACB7NY81_9PEZI|nr:hypothetical protein F5144DRAFT_358659 [Chaetomium globosum]
MAPTPTLPQAISQPLLPRQEQPTTTVIIDADPANNDGPTTTNPGLDGGAIAGIVIGTVVGLLLLWWIIRSCTRRPLDGPDPGRQGWYDDTLPPAVRARSRSRSTGRHHHHHPYDHHHHHHASRRSGSRHHSRRRSSTPRPVMVEERYAAVPVRPAAAYYAAAPAEGRRSRSRSQGRYYVSG